MGYHGFVRRVGRFIFNGVTVLSLLVCLATAWLWTGATNIADGVVYHSSHKLYMAMAWRMGMQFGWVAGQETGGWEHIRVLYRHRGYGFVYEPTSPEVGVVVGLPYWFICLITALAPAVWLTARLRRKRPPPGLCPNCRYDLRATLHRCPECGHVPARSAEKTRLTTKDTKQTKEDQEARMEDGG